MKRTVAGLSALAFATVLTGCTASAEPSTAGSSAASPLSIHGPWAEAITSTYAQTADPRVKAALSDGIISGQEVAFFKAQILGCLEQLHVRGSWGDDGSLQYTGSKSVSQDSINDCNRQNGLDLITLHQAMNRNPKNLDENEILVSCLKRANVVGPEYTTNMLKAGVSVESFIDSPEFEKCNNDPLNYKK